MTIQEYMNDLRKREIERSRNRKQTAIFECRACSNTSPGDHLGPFAKGWSQLENIDGPPHVCAECAKDQQAVLEMFRDDGYKNVRFAGHPKVIPDK